MAATKAAASKWIAAITEAMGKGCHGEKDNHNLGE
jgi:hypothetical protein